MMCNLLENENKHGFFEILLPKSILLVPSFPHVKNGNSEAVHTEVLKK